MVAVINDDKEEKIQLLNYIGMLEDRLQKIADYVGADDYIDSIGPILEAIDCLKQNNLNKDNLK